MPTRYFFLVVTLTLAASCAPKPGVTTMPVAPTPNATLQATPLPTATAAPASPTATATPSENVANLIQPGVKIGNLELNAERPQIHKLLGRPNISYPQGELMKDFWGAAQSDNFLAVTYRRGKVVQIEVSAPKFATREGLSTKSSLAEVQRAYPQLNKTAVPHTGEGEEGETLYYDDAAQGITFIFISDKCYSIAVHPPGAPAVRAEANQ